MRSRTAAVMVALAVLVPSITSAADDVTLLRVFLTDGTSLVSYGEPALAGSRVVFSMPTASTPNPPLHLVNLPLDRVDWERTSRYAANARATRYVQTQADIDYAELSSEVAATLNEVARTTEPARRLQIVEEARKTLADWPQNHYNYRRAEVLQMLSMLDEAIADLQAATGRGRFTLSLSAFVDPPAVVEPLLPPPTPKGAIEQVLAAARVSDGAVDRTSLLSTAMTALDRDKSLLPAAWAESARTETEIEMKAELAFDRAYRELTARTMAYATWRARRADVRGLERLLTTIPDRDAALGSRRPEAVQALIGAVEGQLDAARRLRLARDRFAMRAPVLSRYRLAIDTPMALFAQLRPSLEDVKSLAGSTPRTLAMMQRTVGRILTLVNAIVPPEEAAAAHALLVSAVQLAGNAAQIRREATLAGDIPRAWDASSAAAGALMLGARARADITTLLRPPQLR